MIPNKGFYAVKDKDAIQFAGCDKCGKVEMVALHGTVKYCRRCWLAEDLEVKEAIRNNMVL